MADFYGPVNDGNQLKLSITSVQDVETNSSSVHTVLRFIRNAGFVADANMRVQIVTGGVQTYWWTGYASYPAGEYVIADATRTIAHNSAGQASVTVTAFAYGAATTQPNVAIAVNNLTLPTIPRATTPTLPSGVTGFTTGTAQTIQLLRANPDFTHDVTWEFGGKSGTIATGAGVSASWTPADSILTEIPNAVSALASITVVTKSGGTVVGSQLVRFPVTAAASVVPTVSAVTWDDANTVVKTAIGAFVQGLSLVKGAVTAAGVHGSTIVSKQLTVAGATLTESQFWQPTISGPITASGSAIDSRARGGTKSADFNVLAYAPPVLAKPLVRRAIDAGGTVGEGAFLRLDLTAAVQSLIVGSEKNALKLKVETRPVGGAWTTRNNITHTGLSYSDTLVMVTGGAVFPVNQSFDVRVTISDNCGQQAVVMGGIGTGGASFDIAASGTGHGKIHERGGIDVAGDGYIAGDLYLNDVKASKEGHTHTGAQVTEASETARGTVERATAAEVNAGTDTTRYVSPKTLANMLPWATAVNVTISAATGGTVALTFPAGKYATPPFVQTTKVSGALAMYIPYANSITKDGCVIGVFSGNNTPASGTQPIHVTVFPA